MSEVALNADRINDIFEQCLFAEGEDSSGAIVADGIRFKAGFHPERLNQYRDQIWAMLLDLPDTFLMSVGGGWTFLNMCIDKRGSQWGEQSQMEQLVMLGLAMGMVDYVLPRESWDYFPMGMPYIVVLDVSKDIAPDQTKSTS